MTFFDQLLNSRMDIVAHSIIYLSYFIAKFFLKIWKWGKKCMWPRTIDDGSTDHWFGNTALTGFVGSKESRVILFSDFFSYRSCFFFYYFYNAFYLINKKNCVNGQYIHILNTQNMIEKTNLKNYTESFMYSRTVVGNYLDIYFNFFCI